MASEALIVGSITIPPQDLSWTATRSSGPGGQNVNKVASKVDLRFDFEHSEALSHELKARIRESAATRLDADGRLQITSQLTRNQPDNLEDARLKLAEILRASLTVPKQRRKTKPSRAKKAARVADKRVQAQKKQSRGRVAAD